MALERELVQFCAPTLAGLKTGSVFSVGYESEEKLRAAMRSLNRRLRGKGLSLMLLRLSRQKKRALLYLCRPHQLRRDLKEEAAESILGNCGYCCGDCARCIARLGERLRSGEDFPHEIGLFLGYPAEDVKGFMDEREPTCVGEWKAYGDAEAARETFSRHKKCTRIYCEQWARGNIIERLAVAG